MIRTSRRLTTAKILLICLLIFIWGNSLMPGEISGGISNKVKELLASVLPIGAQEEDGGGHLIRKLAHFTEFAALGATLGWLFGMLNKGKIRPFVCGVLAASADETIQRFVPDRGPSVKDVFLDSCGVLAGMVLLYLGHTYFKNIGGKQNEENDLCCSGTDAGSQHDRLRR